MYLLLTNSYQVKTITTVDYIWSFIFSVVSLTESAFTPPTSLAYYGGGLPVFPGMPAVAPSQRPDMSKSIPTTSVPSNPLPAGVEFTQSEIDMLLYGYATPRSKSECGLAISGLKICDQNKSTGA